MLVSKPTHGGGAPLGIDLDAGVATIKIVRPAPAAAEDNAGAPPEPPPAPPTPSTEDSTDGRGPEA